MRHYLVFTLSLGLVLPRALDAQWAERSRTGALGRPVALETIDLNTALARQRVADQRATWSMGACKRSLGTNVLAGVGGGVIAGIILIPMYSVIRNGYHGVQQRASVRDAAMVGALVATGTNIRETIRCKRRQRLQTP
jgi:hypothetical protein